ncbi:MAG: hypothetical protein IPJ20_19605 [Flammeovirgaceae bacterium]|nr:hypothetical protein [Flammeovirgaceae bacterium]
MTTDEQLKHVDAILFSLPLFGVTAICYEANDMGDVFYYTGCEIAHGHEVVVDLPDNIMSAAEAIAGEVSKNIDNYFSDITDDGSMVYLKISTTPQYNLLLTLSTSVSESGDGSCFEGELNEELGEQLTLTGSTKFSMSYDGSGDSGGMTQCEFYKGDKEFRPKLDTQELTFKLEDVVYLLGEANFNDNGSSGEAVFTLKEDGRWLIDGNNSYYEDITKEDTYVLYSSQSASDTLKVA